MATLDKTIVYLWAKDIISGTIGSLQNAKLCVSNPGALKNSSIIVCPSITCSDFNSSGFASVEIDETETSGTQLLFSVVFQEGKSIKSINFDPAIVPNAGAIDLTSISDISKGGLS